MTVENIVTKGAIAKHEQFLILLQNSIIILSFKELFHVYALTFSKLSAAELLFFWKRLFCYLLYDYELLAFNKLSENIF